MSPKPTSPAASEGTTDQPKGSITPEKSLSEQTPESQDEDHGDQETPVPSVTSTNSISNSNSNRNSESPSRASPARSVSSRESGEASPVATTATTTADTNTSAPPLPNEPPPAEDDGWDFHWDAAHQAYFFYNRFTHQSTWDNPRLPKGDANAGSAGQSEATSGIAEPPKDESLPAGGYNPAIHGDYDPNAWYAKGNSEDPSQQGQPVNMSAAYAAIGSFNRFTGRWQGADRTPGQHSDEAKSRRQMNAFFDVDAAANSHDGRSLRAERSGKKPSKTELKHFKEKRRARKEEKRRAWLRD
ncbi:hypothetical protein F4809DRAFT_588055 [Biscogniauxia mediterranea]|nr:hypothetical protein F4809DRAFT_588055 [Biscogniauxia mediterranea]